MGKHTFPRWLAHAITLGLLALVALCQPGAASAQTPTTATLLFLDERDLRVDFDRLRGQQGSLTVEVYNKGLEAQTVELRLVGLAPLTGRADPKLGWIMPDVVRQQQGEGERDHHEELAQRGRAFAPARQVGRSALPPRHRELSCPHGDRRILRQSRAAAHDDRRARSDGNTMASAIARPSAARGPTCIATRTAAVARCHFRS